MGFVGRAFLVAASSAVLCSVLAVSPALAQGDITVAKDTMRIQLTQRSCDMDDEGCKSGDIRLYPSIEVQVNGAKASGAQPWVEFRSAGKAPLRLDCSMDEVFGQENRWRIYGGGLEFYKNHILFPGKLVPGTIEFTIGVRNELMETSVTVYEGSFKFEKVLRVPGDETTAEPYVNDDWKLPIGYLYADYRGLHVVTWYRGRPGGVKTYLFHNGQPVAQNEECGIGSEADFDPEMKMWWEVDCQLTGVYGDAESAASGYEPNYDLSKNPGEYEIKALAAGKLARVVKFTVGPDGSFDNGIAKANSLGSDRVIVPVEIRLDKPAWDRTAWKSGAYYGHPLKGFAGPE